MNVVDRLAEVEFAHHAGGQNCARAPGSSGIPSTRAKSLPRPPGSTPTTPSECCSASATAPMSPSPPSATATSPARAAARARLAPCSRLRVGSTWCSRPRRVSACLHRRESASGATPTGGRDSRSATVFTSTGEGREGPRRWPPEQARWLPPLRRPGAPGEHDRAVQAGGVGAGQVGVQAVADNERPPVTEPVEGSEKDLRRRLADGGRGGAGGILKGSHDRARGRPRSVVGRETCGRDPRRSSPRRPVRPAWRL